MAKRAAYGNTWWSQQWLNSLTHIDFDNRLPRGRTYANKGAVRALKINKGTITAQVKGSRSTPYRVKIESPALTKSEADTLLKKITQDPVVIARLLNRELDPSLLQHTQSLGIALFPTRWRDLKMNCSCPDWAVPCKHLAAVIYLISREIDSNPLLVFSLRGVDLVQVLKKNNVDIGQEVAQPLPELKQRWSGKPSVLRTNPEGMAAMEAPDFSRLPALSTALLHLLSPAPAFFGLGDFREILRSSLQRAGKAARKALNDGGCEAATLLTAEDRPRLELLHPKPARISDAKGIADLAVLLDALTELDAAQLPDYQPETAGMHLLNQTALHLLAQGAVVPQIFTVENTAVELHWFPASLDSTVRSLLSCVADALPEGLVGWQKGKRFSPLSRTEQAECLCALILDHYIQRWSGISALDHDKTVALFFTKGVANYDGSGEGSIAAGVHSWLSRLHLMHKDYVPVLQLEEAVRTGFDLSLVVEKRSAALEPPVPLLAILTQAKWSRMRYGVLQTISLLAEYFPPLNDYLSHGAKTPLRLQADGLPTFLFEALPILRFLGIRILLPKALEQLRRPRLSMQIKGNANDGQTFLNTEDLLHFDWKVAVGDHLLSRTEFEKLLRSAAKVVRFKGEYVYLDAREIEQLQKQLAKPPSLSGSELLRVALAGEFAGASVGLDRVAMQRLKQLTEVKDVALPKKLQASLRPYQQRGYAWLYRNVRMGLGSVLADDMGLGKTLQVITTILKLKEERGLAKAKVLVIVPTTLLTNWQKELIRFAPSLSVSVFHGAKRELPDKRPDVLLTTFGVARRAATTLKSLAWKLVVIDEAQNIKNPASAQTKAAKTIPAESYIAMSGTPVENRLSEYWSIMDFANRGYLGNLTQFVRDYAKPIQNEHDQTVVTRFKKVTAPFLLRRLKSDKSIIADLPDKIEQDQYCTLGKEQTALYQSVVEAGLRTIAGESDTFKRQGLVLQMILALKQICNHPAQYLKQGDGDALLSGKAERLFELLDEIQAQHEKVLVFTQYREMGNLLSQWIQQRYGREPLFLHGGVRRNKRDEMVERFQLDRTERIFLLSLKAGGTGLNLTAASNVVHYDLWWNPAVEAQATDRAYRIGQQNNVLVHRFITRGTFEERINDMIRDKKALAELTVGAGEQWIGNLTSDELQDLFAYGN